jgi:hypothetical protein
MFVDAFEARPKVEVAMLVRAFLVLVGGAESAAALCAS